MKFRLRLEGLESRALLTLAPINVPLVDPSGIMGNNVDFPKALGESVLFQSFNGNTLAELWRSDGTASGTYLVKDLTPGLGTSYPLPRIAFQGQMFLTAASAETGEELWKTSGAPNDLELVRDINPNGSSRPQYVIQHADQIFFVAEAVGVNDSLWRSDGATDGTLLVKDLGGNTHLSDLVSAADLVFFMRNNDVWTSDGTSDGTIPLHTPGASFTTLGAAALGDSLLMTGGSAATGRELWRTDGTTEGTQLLLEVSPGGNSTSFTPLVVVNDLAFFGTRAADGRTQYWRSDGTPGGAYPLLDTTTSGFGPSAVAASGSFAYFNVVNANGATLWRSDGTVAGTIPLREFDSGASHFADVDGVLFFAATEDFDEELWMSDGTPEGTQRVADLLPGSFSSRPRDLVNAQGRLYFEALSDLWFLEERLPGDANGDLAVDSDDLAIWADHFSQAPATFSEGDFNLDGRVSGADYTIWADEAGGAVGVRFELPLAPTPMGQPAKREVTLGSLTERAIRRDAGAPVDASTPRKENSAPIHSQSREKRGALHSQQGDRPIECPSQVGWAPLEL